jgi:hypothetical protein
MMKGELEAELIAKRKAIERAEMGLPPKPKQDYFCTCDNCPKCGKPKKKVWGHRYETLLR